VINSIPNWDTKFRLARTNNNVTSISPEASPVNSLSLARPNGHTTSRFFTAASDRSHDTPLLVSLALQTQSDNPTTRVSINTSRDLSGSTVDGKHGRHLANVNTSQDLTGSTAGGKHGRHLANGAKNNEINILSALSSTLNNETGTYDVINSLPNNRNNVMETFPLQLSSVTISSAPGDFTRGSYRLHGNIVRTTETGSLIQPTPIYSRISRSLYSGGSLAYPSLSDVKSPHNELLKMNSLHNQGTSSQTYLSSSRQGLVDSSKTSLGGVGFTQLRPSGSLHNLHTMQSTHEQLTQLHRGVSLKEGVKMLAGDRNGTGFYSARQTHSLKVKKGLLYYLD